MANAVLSADHFKTEEAAFAYVEATLWPNGPECPHCGGIERISKMGGKSTRLGTYKCYQCRKPFTVRVGTIFESSHLPLHLWLQVIHLMCASKKGISTRQIQRMLNCSMKTAWHLTHRIRHAMAPAADAKPLGGPGVTVEADESEIAPSRKTKRKPGHRRSDNPAVFSLVERGGKQRSMIVDHNGVRPLIRKHLDAQSRLVTDMAQHYKHPPVAIHEAVDHSKEYVRGDVHTNTLEGFFSILKRGLIGTYQHVDTKHFNRYLAEFDFRQNTRGKLGINDEQRAVLAIKATKGKRLTYETTAESKTTN